jgi:glycosyltransferase involved in cell wall biosynthesis
MVESKSNQQIGYIVRSYPRLSQTFILNEIVELEQAGVALQIFAITHPVEEVTQPQVNQIKAPVYYLESCLHRSLLKILAEHVRALLCYQVHYLSTLLFVLFHFQIDQGYTASSRFTCFLYAIHLAQKISKQGNQPNQAIRHLHAHFAHDPALIAQLVYHLTGMPYSFTAHARDVFQVPQAILSARIETARAVVTCCRANLEYLRKIAPTAWKKLHIIYHGVNLKGFHPASSLPPETEIPLIVSIGRLVEKKGFFDLLSSLEQVKQKGIPFRCEIYGDGPLKPQLQTWIDQHGFTNQVVLAGNRNQAEIIPVLQMAAMFVLTPTVTEDGDREGIPNVLVEAMAVGLPVISTAIAGIPELITSGQNGLLFPAHDIDAITGGMIELLQDREKRRQLGSAASWKVSQQFDVCQAAATLKLLFYSTLQPESPELAESRSEQVQLY